MAGPTAAGSAISAFGLSGAFILSSIIALVGLILGLNLVRNTSLWLSLQPPTRQSLRRIFSLRPAVGSFSALVLFGAFYGVIIAYLPLYLVDTFSASATTVTIFFAAYFAIASVVRLSLTRLLTKIKKPALLQCAFLTATVAFVVLYFGASVQALLVSLVLLSIPYGMIYPTSAIIVSEEVNEADTMLANCLVVNSVDFGIAAGPIATSFLAAQYGIASSFLGVSIASALGIAVAGKMLRKVTKSEP